ncbi:MAG TPA: TAXI family TRAP transporter solute-binding subunit [Burkholderiaceae bacterium]|nr:TAXI family TRAP transporter solute-binding subunit [Burkholderiaceae bacterium]
MTATLRHTLLSVRDLALTAGPFVILTLVLLLLAYWVLDPTPPSRVVLATGASQGAYAQFGKRYADLLKGYGIKVELRATDGAAENLKLLRDPHSGVDIAFVQGGADDREDARRDEDTPDDGLRSLGSMFFEPVWLFYREDSAQKLTGGPVLNALSQLPGWRLNIGPPGSGVPNLMMRILQANRIDAGSVTLLREAQTPAVVALLEGRSDALVFASAPDSLMVQMLLQTPGIRLFDFAQSEAYARRFAFMSPVSLPRGVVDLARDVPPQDVHLVAPTATLVAKRHLHPALVQLFVQAAQTVHGEAGWFQHKGEFPNAQDGERPLSREAQRFYRGGQPFLQHYLPFWVANLVDRMWVALASIIVVLIPLSRVVPPLYQFRIRSRVFRWYGQLRRVEEAQGRRPPEELLKELDAIEAHVEQVSVPLSYADELYALRSHIALVRQRLHAAMPAAS